MVLAFLSLTSERRLAARPETEADVVMRPRFLREVPLDDKGKLLSGGDLLFAAEAAGIRQAGGEIAASVLVQGLGHSVTCL